MLRMVLRKMFNNPWMILCLLIGSILAVSMVSSIPIYTDGVLQRMLTKDLENYQLVTNNYPGKYYVKSDIYGHFTEENRTSAYRSFDKAIVDELVPEIDLPIIANTRNITIDYLTATPEIIMDEEDPTKRVDLNGIECIGDHIDLIHGRMFSSEKVDDYYEVIVTEEAMKYIDLRLDEFYTVADSFDSISEPMRFKVVGVFNIKDVNDPFWNKGLKAYKSSFLMDFDLLKKVFVDTGSNLITTAEWFYAFDYHKMTLDNIKPILNAYESQNRYYAKYRSLNWEFPAIEILKEYGHRETQLKMTMWVLIAPILIMLAFYLIMVSQLIIDGEKNEIAVMKSRGASSTQVFFTYLLESLLLSIVALLLGPPLGLLLCKVLGSSNGFLEFVDRTALPLSLSPKAYKYSIFAIILFMATMLIPALSASNTTIVEHKRKKTRGGNKPFWKKFYLDIILLTISLYGLYTYNNRQSVIMQFDVQGAELTTDPLIYLISTMFILGAGLLFLRFYPSLINLIFWIGKKKWSPVLYASFTQVGRSSGQSQFLMLFLIFTLSIGIFNANSARTINANIEEKIRYEMGADIVIDAYWPDNQPSMPTGASGNGILTDSAETNEPIQYQEPPFMSFENLDGVKSATKVFKEDQATVTGLGERANSVRIMGIIPDEFGEMAWFRDDLLPYHINEYLNLMSQDPRAILVSSTFKEKYGYKEGDTVYITWKDQGSFQGIIYAFIDYWPTYNPNEKLSNDEPSDFVVASYPYIRSKMALEPYEIWIEKEDDALSQDIYNDIEEKSLSIVDIEDTNQKIIEMKNDPMLQGTNGVLTLGFIVTIVIAIIGFLIYWVLSIRKRVLNFGIYRAMGLSKDKIIGMLICEQVLISGIAIIIGIVLGGVSSKLFVPLFQIAQNATDQVPPFHVVTDIRDYKRIYTLVGIMLIMGIVVLSRLVSKIKVAQAIKLGED